MPRLSLLLVSLAVLLSTAPAFAQIATRAAQANPVRHPTCTASTTSGCTCLGVGQCSGGGHSAICQNGNQFTVCVEDHNGGCDCETYEENASIETPGGRASQAADF